MPINADRPMAEVTAQIFGVIESQRQGGCQQRDADSKFVMSFGEDRIVRKSPDEIEKMRRSGKIVRQVLNHLKIVVAAA